jgi:HEAT repeat protein
MPKQARAPQAHPPLSWQETHGASAPDDVMALLALTYDPRPSVRRWAAHRLCPCGLKRNVPQVWDRLLAMASDPDAAVRAQILHTLCDGSPRERQEQVLRAIQGMHDDPHPALRRRARQVLAQYRRTGRINVL